MPVDLEPHFGVEHSSIVGSVAISSASSNNRKNGGLSTCDLLKTKLIERHHLQNDKMS